jgi:hypothetical protein
MDTVIKDSEMKLEMQIYLAKVGFPVESEFSANGLTKIEFHNIKVEATSEKNAKNRLIKGYGSDIMLVSIKRFVRG